MSPSSSSDPLDLVLRAIRADRQALSSHPGDLPSIALNRMARERGSWAELDTLLGIDDRSRPLLRWQRAIETSVNPTTIVSGHDITACAVGRDHSVVAGTGSGDLLVWSSQPSTAMERPDVSVAAHSGRVTLVEFSSSSQELISGGEDGAIHFWRPSPADTDVPTRSFEGHSSAITAVVYPLGRETLAAGAEDGSVRVWQQESSVRVLIGHSAAVTAMAASPDGRFLISASRDATLRVWDVSTGRAAATLRGHAGDVIACVVMPANDLGGNLPQILSASIDGLLKIWSLDGQLIATLGGHQGPIRDMRYLSSPAGGSAVTASDDGTVRLWDLKAAREARVIREHGAVVLQAVPYGDNPRRVLSVTVDGVCRIADLDTGRVLREMKAGGAGDARLAVAASGNMAVCVTADGALAHA